MLQNIKSKKNLLSGFTVALVVFVTLLVFVAIRQDHFNIINTYFNTSLGETNDLQVGDRITYKGVNIGEISKMALVNDRIEIQIMIYKKYLYLVRKDSKLGLSPALDLKGALLGSSMNFIPGDKDAPLLAANSTIETLEESGAADMLSDLIASTQEQITVLVENLNKIFSGESGEGASNIFENVVKITNNVEEITSKLPAVIDNYNEVGTKTIATMNNLESQLTVTLDNMNNTLKNADVTFANSDKTLAAFYGNSEDITGLLTKADAVMTEANDIMFKINNGWLLGGGREYKKHNDDNVFQFNNIE